MSGDDTHSLVAAVLTLFVVEADGDIRVIVVVVAADDDLTHSIVVAQQCVVHVSVALLQMQAIFVGHHSPTAQVGPDLIDS